MVEEVEPPKPPFNWDHKISPLSYAHIPVEGLAEASIASNICESPQRGLFWKYPTFNIPVTGPPHAFRQLEASALVTSTLFDPMSQPNDVETELVFWRQLEGQRLEVDFTKMAPEKCMAAQLEPDTSRTVQIKDIRGKEAQYNLKRNGFQYVWHDMPELEGVAEESHVENVIIPKTEALVRQM